LGVWGLSIGSVRPEVEDVWLVIYSARCCFRLDAEDMWVVKWQF
jgi:hypothetical protein